MSEPIEMTIIKRLLRKLINFLVERYFPNTFFWGNEFGSAFNKIANGQGAVDTAPKAAAAYLINYLSDRYIQEGKFDFGGVSLKGRYVGNWSITIKKENGGGA